MTVINEDLLADLEKWAEQEQRTVSNLVALLLRRAVEAAKSKGELQ